MNDLSTGLDVTLLLAAIAVLSYSMTMLIFPKENKERSVYRRK